jgi:class 3 adenylate cyclase
VIEQAGGKIVKFIGDAIFIIFPHYLAKKGIKALQDLKEKVDDFFKNEGVECVLHVKAHIGSVTYGRVGMKDNKHFDVFGHEVNVAALLSRGGFVLSSKLEEIVSSESVTAHS